MIKCILILAAEGIVRDAASNNISAFNIIEEINTEILPAIIPRFGVLFMLERDQDGPNNIEVNLNIELAGQNLAKQSVQIDFENTERHRSVVKFQGMAITTIGELAISVTYDDESLGQY